MANRVPSYHLRRCEQAITRPEELLEVIRGQRHMTLALCRDGEPYLVTDGCARIGEGSGSTNVLTGSGVDEAWTTGVQLAEGVLELAREGSPFTRENLERAYVSRRRASWVEQEGRIAERARVGFHSGLITGLVGMALAGGDQVKTGARAKAEDTTVP